MRTADDEAESHMSLTIGHTYVTGYSKQPGETATGGELIDVFGSDLEFINSVELLDADGVPQLIDHKDFYRKGTYKLTIRLPKKNIYKGTFVGILHTYDGQSILMPELAYEPGADEGHWETVKTTIWKNEDPDVNGVVNWNGTYRFGLDGHDGNNECIATFPEDVWNTLKTGTFYILYSAPDPTQYQIRVTNGWWDTQWMGKDNDIAPWNMAERIIDNGDGTFYIEVNFGDDPLVGTLDEKHLLLTGSGYTPLEIYTEEDIWIDGPGGDQEVKTVIWTGDGTTAVNWNGVYRFGLDGHDGNNECIATFPEDIWNRLKTETFYVKYTVADPTQYQIRVTNGWWDTQWMGKDNDIAPWNMAERIIDNGDGTFYIEVNLGDDPLVGTLDEKHLLLTGSGYTPLEIYFIDIIHGGGGGSENVFWENSGAGAVSWNGTYRFGLDGHDGNNECITTFPQDIWDKIKSSTFYLVVEATDPQIRVTNGWWDTQWLKDFQPGNDLLTDNGDGTWTLEINISGDPLVDTIDEKHILFTGDRFTPVKLYFK